MTTYYAICNANGPISRRLHAAAVAEAIAEFKAGDSGEWIDSPATDAEDDLDICGDGMSETEFSEALTKAGLEPVCDLSPAVNAHAGGWMLWRFT